MRVVISFPHALGAPGIGWTAMHQARGLIARGHEVHAVVASVREPVPGVASLTTSMSKGPARLPHRAIGRDRAFRWHDRVAAAVVRRVQPDVVHLWPLGAGRAAAAGLAAEAAVVREAPNTQTELAWRVVAEEVARIGLDSSAVTAHTPNPVRLRMARAEWSAATAILAPSESVAESFRDAGYPSVVRHQYGYSPGHGTPRPRSADPGPLRAVFVGLGEPRKGLHHALSAWLASQASREGTLTVVGRVLPAYADLLREQLADPSVRVRGFVRNVPQVFREADVLLLPSLEEGSALVTYEAQGEGCVPLVSRAAGAVLTHGEHGLVHEPGDTDTLRRHLDELSQDRHRLAAMSAASIAHGPHLTWEAAAGHLERAYGEALEQRDGAASFGGVRPGEGGVLRPAGPAD